MRQVKVNPSQARKPSTATPSTYNEPSVYSQYGVLMEDVTVSKCFRANGHCRGGSSDLEVGVKLTSGIGSFHGGGLGGTSATIIFMLRLWSIEKIHLIRARSTGSKGGTGEFGFRDVLIT